ncbi:STAS domain-containing protein [Blastococcus deserti]|uniref:STAS domain-containing protein n=1 Tax=Blastococcus deserti TaxID=2259033 RepID=A0ABW4XH39_9ACTN
MPQLNAALVPAPDQVVVRFTGEVDLSTVSLVADALTQAAGLGTRQVVVDIAAARFWDCSGLHALADCTRELSAAGRACRIVGALPATRRLIGMANLADRLQLDGIAPGGTGAAAGHGGGRDSVPARRPVRGHAAARRNALATAGRGR